MSRETILLRQIEAELRQAGGKYNPREARRGFARVHLWGCTQEVFRHD